VILFRCPDDPPDRDEVQVQQARDLRFRHARTEIEGGDPLVSFA